MKKTVFISSTFIDLKDERNKVWECLEKYDVIVKGMEEFGARKTDPLTTCLLELQHSDIYVGIIGMRFGSEDPKSQKSFTQLEYEQAIASDKEILIYIIDEETADVKPNIIQFDKYEKLAAFKKTLKEKHTIDTFSNAQDLVSKLQTKFESLLSFIDKDLTKDDYKNTCNILDSFFLVPKAFSGREIKLKIKFKDTTKPASKEICDLFNLNYGYTIVALMDIIYPKCDFKASNYLFIDYDFYEQFIKLDKSLEYEIFANILFKESKAKSIIANFQNDRESISYYESPFETKSMFTSVLEPAEGQIVLRLKQISP